MMKLKLQNAKQRAYLEIGECTLFMAKVWRRCLEKGLKFSKSLEMGVQFFKCSLDLFGCCLKGGG